MPTNTPMPASQRIVQICLFLFAAIGLSGGALQFYLGQPETTPRLDNVHRFLAGIYFGCGLICLWAAITVREQRTLVLLLGLGSATSCLSCSCRCLWWWRNSSRADN